MRRAPFALLTFVVASAFARSPAPEVIFISPCECEGFHGIHRWIAKTDLTPVPLDKSAIQSVTPSQIYAWEGIAPDVDITVTGKAFYDIGHAPADHSNRRSTPKNYAVWEIHPVMKTEVIP